MTSRARVSKSINSARRGFEACLETFFALKAGGRGAAQTAKLLSFQYELAIALFAVDEAFLEVAARKRSIIARKNRVSARWFRDSLRRLDSYSRALETTLRIGKCIGDAFAWFLYSRSTHLLGEHLKHPGQLHTPPGIGGRGELEIAGRITLFPNHILLYHGITTFLRVGDVSLLHLPSMTVSAVAELKTRLVGDNSAEISISVVGKKDVLASRIAKVRTASSKGPHARPSMPARQADRLRRQLARMADVVGAKGIGESGIEIAQATNLLKIDTLLRRTRLNELTHERLDDGLAAVAVRFRRGVPLSGRLLPRHESKVASLTDAAPSIAMSLADQSSNENSLLMEELYLGFQAGLTPLLWAPLSRETLRALLFHEAAVWTWFNPRHLVLKLRARGFEVETGSGGVPISVVAVTRPGSPAVQALDSFLPLIQQHLFTESGFVDTVERALEAVESARLPRNARVKMYLSQHYGSPPTARIIEADLRPTTD